MPWRGPQHQPGENLSDKALPFLQLALLAQTAAQCLQHLNDARSWAIGCAGEQQIANRLSHLPRSDWTILHGVPIGWERDIDHLVISRAGVFAVDTKVRLGAVSIDHSSIEVDGIATDMIARSVDAAITASAFLSDAVGVKVWVTPVIALIASQVRFESRPRRVETLLEKQLIPWLTARPTRLARRLADRIAWAAGAPATWPTSRAA